MNNNALKELRQVYDRTEKRTPKDKRKEIYTGLGKKRRFGALPPRLQEIIKITEPNISNRTVIRLGFGHFKEHTQERNMYYPEAYSFSASWKRTNVPEDVETMVNGIYFNVEITENGLEYEVDASSISNARSNAQREVIFQAMSNARPETAPLSTEYHQIKTSLAEKETRDKLLEEFLALFLESQVTSILSYYFFLTPSWVKQSHTA